ncbi:hypothetical protein [Gracilibacillus dipsosauri]|uniref:hypothetical protein n=1 Tax=Gracilibacillus dipsosauri TaxID=178340 RepID=UPI002409B3F9
MRRNKMTRNPYIRTNWRDHIVDIETGQVIQEGTRFTASRANNIEDGIYSAHEILLAQDRLIKRLSAELGMVGRSPINNGVYYEPLDGGEPRNMERLTERAVVQNAVSAGATTLTLDDVPFSVNQVITIYDEENSESVTIESINGNDVTVSALANAYKKGAYVARSNAAVDVDNEELTFGTWGTYTISVSEVV